MIKTGTGADPQPLRIAQITDTHIYADPDTCLLGLNTRRSLQQVVERVRTTRPPDLVVASGDLSHDGSAEAYACVREQLGTLGAPVYCLPGNHDENTMLHDCMNSDGFHVTDSLCTGGWQLLFLDSTRAGSEGGHLADNELEKLDSALAARPELPALVWLHHQPVKVGSRWLDSMAVDNPQALFDIIDRHAQLRAIIWGHVHQCFEQQRNGVQLLATPSTGLQFLPGSEDFAIDMIPPGYRWLELNPDGTFRTGIQRLDSIPGTIDPAARGY